MLPQKNSAPPQLSAPSKSKKLLLWGATILVSLILGIGFLEAALRIAWRNPLDTPPVGLDYRGYIRLQDPHVQAIFNVSGLYEGADLTRFRTDKDGSIIGVVREDKPLAHFYGSSSTEGRYVKENARWPDLVESVNPRSYSVSGNSLIDSYYNLKFHLETGKENKTPIREVFFMHGIEDFAIFNIVDAFDFENFKRSIGTRASNRRANKSRIYLRDAVGLLLSNAKADKLVINTYKAEAIKAKEKPLPQLSDAEFAVLLKEKMPAFLASRSRVFSEIATLAKNHGVKVTFVSQPNTYREDYVPFNELDLRLYPRWKNKKLSLDQAAIITAMINENTRQNAMVNRFDFIDVAKGFKALQPGPLFYDAYHLSAKGTEFFAKIVNESRLAQTGK